MADEFNARMVTLAREAEGLTQSALAHLAGISQGHISKIENGFEDPQQSVLEIMRCLKRYIARDAYRMLTADRPGSASSPAAGRPSTDEQPPI